MWPAEAGERRSRTCSEPEDGEAMARDRQTSLIAPRVLKWLGHLLRESGTRPSAVKHRNTICGAVVLIGTSFLTITWSGMALLKACWIRTTPLFRTPTSLLTTSTFLEPISVPHRRSNLTSTSSLAAWALSGAMSVELL